MDIHSAVCEKLKKRKNAFFFKSDKNKGRVLKHCAQRPMMQCLQPDNLQFVYVFSYTFVV